MRSLTVKCSYMPGDKLVAKRRGSVAEIGIQDHARSTFVVLPLSKLRKLAAWMLRAADEIEGKR